MIPLVKNFRRITFAICTISSIVGFFSGFVEDLVPQKSYTFLSWGIVAILVFVNTVRYFSSNLYLRNFLRQIFYSFVCLTLFLSSGIVYNCLKDKKISEEQDQIGDIPEQINPSPITQPYRDLPQPTPEAPIVAPAIITSQEKPEGEKVLVRPTEEVTPKNTPVPPPVVEPRYRHETPPRVGPNTGL